MRKHIIIILITVGAFLAGCTKSNVQQASEEFNQLPTAVQKAVRTTNPDAEIADVEQESMRVRKENADPPKKKKIGSKEKN